VDECTFATYTSSVYFSSFDFLCSLSSISAAITYSAWWKEVEQVKAREKKKAIVFSERSLACKLLERKTGAQAASRFCVLRIFGGQIETKKNTGAHPLM
jgi:hypothetical protein